MPKDIFSRSMNSSTIVFCDIVGSDSDQEANISIGLVCSVTQAIHHFVALDSLLRFAVEDDVAGDFTCNLGI